MPHNPNFSQSQHNPNQVLGSNETHEFWSEGRIRLGGEEPAICAAIGLSQRGQANPRVRLVVMDVGFRKHGDKNGPYDLLGDGNKREFESDYVIIAKNHDTGEVNITEVAPGIDITLGRQGDTSRRLGYKDTAFVSSKHATLTIKDRGNIYLKDNDSTNGTTFVPSLEDRLNFKRKSNFGYTHIIGEDVSSVIGGRYISPEEEKGWGHGMIDGRPIIASDTPIAGGIYPVGSKEGELLVIDDVKSKDRYDKIYNSLLEKLQNQGIKDYGVAAVNGLKRVFDSESSEKSDTDKILNTVFSQARSLLEYKLNETKALAGPGVKVELQRYVGKGIGVCRHQAALSAYFVERLIKEGHLGGRVYINRNMEEKMDGQIGGHAWARYIDDSGQVYIIDPAQGYVGTLEEAQARGFGWDYRRTEDLVAELLAA